MRKALSLLDTTIGKKVVMALSGLVWFGFALAHMAGNLQVFLGPEVFNGYSVGLHATPGLLWTARTIMIVAFVLHVWTALKLVTLSAAARPVDYAKKTRRKASFAGLTMKFSGLTLLFFVLYHLAHFTFPGVAMGAYEHQHYSMVYSNFVNGFSVPWVVALYVAAMISLGFHLYHGSVSLFQSLGINHPKRNAAIRQTAQFVALIITVGNIILPLSVLLGLVR
jgi:succinate dehydrogenase / fumarate reductase cytochrome b subunit